MTEGRKKGRNEGLERNLKEEEREEGKGEEELTTKKNSTPRFMLLSIGHWHWSFLLAHPPPT